MVAQRPIASTVQLDISGLGQLHAHCVQASKERQSIQTTRPEILLSITRLAPPHVLVGARLAQVPPLSASTAEPATSGLVHLPKPVHYALERKAKPRTLPTRPGWLPKPVAPPVPMLLVVMLAQAIKALV